MKGGHCVCVCGGVDKHTLARTRTMALRYVFADCCLQLDFQVYSSVLLPVLTTGQRHRKTERSLLVMIEPQRHSRGVKQCSARPVTLPPYQRVLRRGAKADNSVVTDDSLHNRLQTICRSVPVDSED